MEQLGSRSLGFSTKQLPQASAMGNIHIGTIAGKLNGSDAGDHAERLAHGPTVDAGADLLRELALQQVRDAGGELDHFEAARGFAAGVGEHFAVLGGDEPGEVVEMLLEELAEAEEHARAAQRRLGGPLRKCGLRGGDGGVQFGAVGQRDQRLHLAGGWVVHIGCAPGGSCDGLAADPMWNRARSARLASERCWEGRRWT